MEEEIFADMNTVRIRRKQVNGNRRSIASVPLSRRLAMDQATSAISKIFSGETRFYTRFNAAQNEEGEHNQVEMKNSSDTEDELGVSVGEHNPNIYSPRQRCSLKFPFVVVVCTLFIFVFGYLLGYATSRKKMVIEPTCPPEIDDRVHFEPEPTLGWIGIQKLLDQKLSVTSFENRLRDFSMKSHEAGSEGDEELATRILQEFQNLDMSPWTDEHYVRVQIPSSFKPNKVFFGAQEIGSPRGYLAYSNTGSVQGRIVYAHYSQPSDFELLLNVKINLTGAIFLVRTGKISFAQKVANAAGVGAAAVLIYPDPADIVCDDNCQLFGHVHLGSGDPYTPGFPSFNHTQFPPAKSSGLPNILAQTITPAMASLLFGKMGGPNAPQSWDETRLNKVSMLKLGAENDVVRVDVHNVLVEKKINNVFGVIKGFVDPDRYVVIGAQRDSWGPGYAKSTVGTCILMELARAITEMLKRDGFRPRRSIIFASWSAGEYGSVGATEWLEGYLTSLSMKAFTYINLDGVVGGSQFFKVAASPLLYKVIRETMKEVNSPILPADSTKSLYDQFAGSNWEESVIVPMKMDESSYPFLTFSGIPSVSFRFTSFKDAGDYPYFWTLLDNKDRLDYATGHLTANVAVTAAQVAGHMVLRLVHDYLLRLDVDKYKLILRSHVSQIVRRSTQLKQSGLVTADQFEALSTQWLTSAFGSFSRAASSLTTTIQNSDLSDVELCRIVNDRIMRVSLANCISNMKIWIRNVAFSGRLITVSLLNQLIVQFCLVQLCFLFLDQFALITWTIQGCANNLVGNVWDLDNEI
ncbi:transferrin receptor protein 1-like [Arapaima gigas]